MAMSHYTMLFEYGKCTRDFFEAFYFFLKFSFIAIFGEGGGGVFNKTFIPLPSLDMR